MPTVSGPGPIDATPTSPFDYLGTINVSGDGCTIRYVAQQNFYFLARTLPNYNAMFSLLMACWLNRHKVSVSFLHPGVGEVGVPDPDTPPSIVAIETVFTN